MGIKEETCVEGREETDSKEENKGCEDNKEITAKEESKQCDVWWSIAKEACSHSS